MLFEQFQFTQGPKQSLNVQLIPWAAETFGNC